MSRTIGWVLLAWFGFAAVAIGAELVVGAAFPPVQLNDQHDQAVAIPGDAKIVLFTADKSASDLVNGYLEDQPDDFLARHGAHFIADISGMPAMVTRLFALPSMRKRAYPILLSRETQTLDFIPRQERRVTVLRLTDGRVRSIEFVAGGLLGDFGNPQPARAAPVVDGSQ